MKHTIKEIRDFIKAKNIKPLDIFSRKDLEKDPVIKKYVEAKKKKAVSDAYQKRKRLQRKYDKLREKMKGDLKRRIKEKDDLITKLKKQREVNHGNL